jgi:two-component system sensor histidine kinase EvgS
MLVNQVRRARRHTVAIWSGAAMCALAGVFVALVSTPAGLVFAGVAAGLAFAGVMVGGAARRDAQREIERLRNSTAEKDSFLASVSHELRTPLTAVVGMLDLVVTERASFEVGEIDEMIGTARNEAAELARLVEDYLTAGQISADALTVQSLVVDLDYEVNRVAAGLPHPDGMRLTIAPDLGECLGDSLRVRQIVRNLLRNALRYGRSAIDVSVSQRRGYAVIVISNDGEPVPDGMIDRLFQPFAGGSRPGQPEPIGLGLSISRDLARRMGGDLEYHRQDDWTSFSLAMPLVGDPTRAPAVGQDASAGALPVG